jgi:hypothetical protein
MHVTIVLGKIIYGNNLTEITSYISNAESKSSHSDTAANAIKSTEWDDLKKALTSKSASAFVEMTTQQFLRFKNAGRMQGQTSAKSVQDPLTGTTIQYQRSDRANGVMEKWDVANYATLVGRVAPWGKGMATNRDHVLAHSINVEMKKQGNNPYGASNDSQLKSAAMAMAVSGHHHRKGSETYGGRVQSVKQAHANNPTVGAHSEMAAMMEWKADATNHSKAKATLRLEMVGAYAYMYKRLVEETVIQANKTTDDLLLGYLKAAVANDDGMWRVDPGNIVKSGLTTQSSASNSHGTKWQVS